MSARARFDIENVCRTCLSSNSSLRSLTALICNDRTIFDVLSDIIDEDIVLSEQLPYQICSECETILFKCEKFRQRCVKSEEVLKNWVISTTDDDKSSISSQVAVNLKNTSADQYQCSICQTKYKNIPELEEHFSLTHLVKCETSYDYYCEVNEPRGEIPEDSDQSNDEEYCDPTDSTIDTKLENADLIIQARRVDADLCDVKPEPIDNVDDKSMDIDTYHCQECAMVFTSPRALKIHLKKKHLSPKNAPVYQCSMCMRKFNKPESLKSHMIRHEEHSRRIYSCKICKREFKHQAHLDNHIESLHTDSNKTSDDTKQHSCNICKKRFHMLSTLKDHYRVHTGEKPFLCSTCGRGFSQKTNLKEHMRRHLGLKPFKCDICNQHYVSKGELVAHQRTHSGAHPFICDTCNSSFTTSSSLVKHRRIHTGEKPYACDFCPMKFTASGTLKNHRRTHTGEKPYHCAHCEKAFIQRNDLIAHTRCHTGERPYVCSVCGQAFRQSSTLKTHVKMHNFKETPALVAFQNRKDFGLPNVGRALSNIICENSSSSS